MPLLYAAVYREDGTPLSEHSMVAHGNIPEVAHQCLQRMIASPEARSTITCDKHTFSVLREGAFIFMVAADEAFGRQVPAACLERISEAWGRSFGAKASRAAAHSFDRAFGPRMREYMEHMNAHPESYNKVAAIQKKVDETRSTMAENIDRVVVRGEKLSVLQDRTEDLAQSAAQFRKQGRQLRQEMWWQGAKVKAAIFGSIFLIIAIIVVVLACFGGANRCVPNKIA